MTALRRVRICRARTATSGSSEAAAASIWEAAKNGDVDAINKHLEGGAKINGKDDKQATPLHWAAVYSQTDAMKLLIDLRVRVTRHGREQQQVLDTTKLI